MGRTGQEGAHEEGVTHSPDMGSLVTNSVDPHIQIVKKQHGKTCITETVCLYPLHQTFVF